MTVLDALDRKILREIQQDSSQSLEVLAKKIGTSKSPIWSRIKKMKKSGTIQREVAIINPNDVGCGNTFIVSINTARHDSEWLERFLGIVKSIPEITEAHRLAGEVDYILKVQVESAEAFDEFYKKLIADISIFNVTSNLSMETIKSTTALKF